MLSREKRDKLKEILNRESPISYSEEECKFLIEAYIEEKKGVTVEYNVRKSSSHLPEPLNLVIARQELTKQMEAVQTALAYFYNHNFNIV